MTAEEQQNIIGRNIKRLLDERDVSNAQLAEALGLSESAVGKWILGRNSPKVGTMQKIADYFSVNMSDLVEEQPQFKQSSKRRYLMDKIAKADDSTLSKIDKLMRIIDDEETNNSW